MGGDWHDLGGALVRRRAEPVALQPLAVIDDAAERGWAAEWIATILAREKISHHAGSEGSPVVGADVACLGADRRADADRPVGAVAVQRAEAGSAALLPGRPLWPVARCRGRAAWRGRRSRPSRPKA